MKIAIALLALSLALAGCVSDPDAAAVLRGRSAEKLDAVLTATKIVPDPHAGWVRILGPAILADGVASGRRYVLQATLDPRHPGGEVRFELQASSGFSKRVFLMQAYAEGRELPTTVIDRERLDCGPGCAVIETVGIGLTAADMERYAQTGLAFEVIGRRKTIRMAIPASYFAGFLAAHRRYREGAA